MNCLCMYLYARSLLLTSMHVVMMMVLQPEFHGMVPVENGNLASLQRLAVSWPLRLKQAAAVCHGLNLIAKHYMVGDLADRQAFEAVEAQFLVSPE